MIGYFSGLMTALVCLTVATFSAAYGEDKGEYEGTYLCKLKKSAGIKYKEESKEWDSATFRVADQSFLMSLKAATVEEVSDDLKFNLNGYEIKIKEYSPDAKWRECTPENYKQDKLVYVNGFVIRFRTFYSDHYQVNLDTLKYQVFSEGDYIGNHDNLHDAPYIDIGQCVKITE